VVVGLCAATASWRGSGWSIRPIFSGRDGVVRCSLAEIELERRVNDSWPGPHAAGLLASDHPAWKARVGSAGSGRK
jgi:hypothetical protein